MIQSKIQGSYSEDSGDDSEEYRAYLKFTQEYC